jgi:class 3 adenylate cyclase/predicted ATPase
MRYVFGDCTLDTQLYVLHRAGQTMHLRSKVYQVLHYLLTHRDRVVAKQELYEQVWPEQFISDAALEGVIKTVRRAVGDSGRTQWCIQTRRGQGYRFVAPLVELVAASQEDEASAELAVSTPLDWPPQESTATPVCDVPEASRRQLTMLVCALVNATALAERLDPEDLREVVLAYQAACTEVIQRFDGYIAQYLGDGLLVYFGYPHAHEDDAQRAVRTGLGILEAIGALNARLERANGLRLIARLGMHTGLVVVGVMGGRGRQERLALGQTPNIAAQLQSLALPNQVVLSERTQRLVGGAFDYDDLGVHALKEIDEPMRVYSVRRERRAVSRFDAATRTGLIPLVGREEELGLVLRRWEQAKEGEGQVVLLEGEPGIGKSRLTQAVHERMAKEPHIWLRYQCLPYYRHSAFYPFMVQIEWAARFARDDTPEQKLDKLEALLAQSTDVVADVVPLFAALLSIPTGDRYPPLHLSPQQQKTQTIEALVAQMVGLSRHQPVLCTFEDVHWSDPTSLEVLALVVHQVQDERVVVVITYRPEFDAPWTAATHVTALTLNRLSRAQSTVLVEHITAGKVLPDEVLVQIVTKADGVPLFVEELTKTVVEAGFLDERADRYVLVGPLPPLAIPTTLQDSLTARLDRLGPVKDVAQIGAAIGREFSYDLLKAVTSRCDTELQEALSQLVDAELLFHRGQPPEARYRFKHALVQDTACTSLLRRRRQQLHTRIATVLEERFPSIADMEPEVLAHHYTEAGLCEKAVVYWKRAGEKAIRRSANVEAISHLTQGLEVLTTLPDTPERIQQELMLHIALGIPLTATRGWAAPAVEGAYTRARVLCRQVGETPQLFPVLRGLHIFYALRGELGTAQELGEQCLTLAQRVEDPALLLEAHQLLGVALFFSGEITPARTHFEQGISLYNPQHHHSHAFLYGGADPGVACLSYGAWILWLLGYPDQALVRSDEAFTLAQELSHPLSLGFALTFAAHLYHFRREEQMARERAEAAMVLSTEQEFALFLALGAVLRGRALARQDQEEEGMAQMRQGMTAVRTMGQELIRPWCLAQLAEACGMLGQIEEGLTVLAEAIAQVDKTGERWSESELHRLKGVLLLSGSAVHQTEVETCFLQALDIASSQQSKSLELRAATSLASLWQKQGKRKEARKLLAPIYNWFSEGFDTADLKDAKALLVALR